MTTRQPLAARRLAVSAPMPVAEPVTMATPSWMFICYLPLRQTVRRRGAGVKHQPRACADRAARLEKMGKIKGEGSMTALQLSIAMHPNVRSRAVLDGRLKTEGIEFFFTALHPSEIFWRQLKFKEFDV